ncbi:putative sarcosine oxidase gamma subunit protein (SoxG) [Marinomonas sp. MED121]|uniref:sarcosine oxidase subunit gamma n=1 Tax=Marinomonas sp. MED121 TaxID=314277 RepID=UPI0000690B49|nr:sarcosine oxidase subunit gamma [Marinomonas sp. MED121]EAQ65821.1 putative sarcosine oxidase gamma subunit protein (SoxG) [Marinomonas sp. MED121]
MNFYNLSSAVELRRSQLVVGSPELINSNISMHDHTLFSRVGFRGRGVESFLREQGLNVPAVPNQSVVTAAGVLVLRLSHTEFWVIDTDKSQHEFIEALELASKGVANVYRLYCQHSHGCFLVRGENTSNMFAKVCGVDLSEKAFECASIAQTSVARVNAIIAKQVISGEEGYLVLSDIAGTQHLWDAIADASAEFN